MPVDEPDAEVPDGDHLRLRIVPPARHRVKHAPDHVEVTADALQEGQRGGGEGGVPGRDEKDKQNGIAAGSDEMCRANMSGWVGIQDPPAFSWDSTD